MNHIDSNRLHWDRLREKNMPRGILDRVLNQKSSLTNGISTDSSHDVYASPGLWKSAKFSLNSTQIKILKVSAICAITLAVLVVCGLGLEMLHVVMIRGDLQKAADTAALAGACSVEMDATKATNDALSAAARSSANGVPVSMKSKDTNVKVQIIRTPSGAPVIGVTAKVRVSHFLQGVFGHPSDDVTATSYAGPVGTVTRVDQGRVFPLAINIDQLAVPKGGNQSAPMTVNLRLGGKAASFITFKEDNKTGDSLKKLIAVAMKNGSGAEKMIPPVSLGDRLYISRNSTVGQTQLATNEVMKSLTGKTILLPVISVGRRKTKFQVLGFINGKVENVHRSRRLVDSISLRIVKATSGTTSGNLKSTGSIQNDRALKEISAAAVKLVSLPAEQINSVAVATRASTNAARSKQLPNKDGGNSKTAAHAETASLGVKPGDGEAVKMASATSAAKTKPPIAVADAAVAVVKNNSPEASKPSRDGADHLSAQVSEKTAKGNERSEDKDATVGMGHSTALSDGTGKLSSSAGAGKNLAPSASSKTSANAMAVQGTTAAQNSTTEAKAKKIVNVAAKPAVPQMATPNATTETTAKKIVNVAAKPSLPQMVTPNATTESTAKKIVNVAAKPSLPQMVTPNATTEATAKKIVSVAAKSSLPQMVTPKSTTEATAKKIVNAAAKPNLSQTAISKSTTEATAKKIVNVAGKPALPQTATRNSTTKVPKDIAPSPETMIAVAGVTPHTGAKQARAKSNEGTNKLQDSSANAKTQASMTREKTATAKATIATAPSAKGEENVPKSTVVASIATPKKIEIVAEKSKIPEKTDKQVRAKAPIDSTAESAPAETKVADVDAPGLQAGTVSGPTTVNQAVEDDTSSLDQPTNTSPLKPVSFKVGMYECMLLIGGLLLSLALVWTYRISKQRGADGDRLRKTFKPLKTQEDSEDGGKGALIIAPATLRASRGKAMKHWGLKKDANAAPEEGKED